jgi:teichuronic acid biosynthesis glycosyltransferase TuaG
VDRIQVSVIIPCYNAQAYLKCAVDSVIQQTLSEWELIIIDNGSTDQSYAIASSYRDSRIQVVSYIDQRGAANARNVGIALAKGEFIAFLDSDDYWEPKKLAIQVQFMKDSDSALTYTDYALVNQEDQVIGVYSPPNKASYNDILRSNYIGCSTVMINTSKLGKVYMPVDKDIREDMACWLSILRNKYTGVKVQYTLVYYRVHPHSSSFNKLKMMRSQYRTYRLAERMGRITSLYYLLIWAVSGIRKYRKITNNSRKKGETPLC